VGIQPYESNPPQNGSIQPHVKMAILRASSGVGSAQKATGHHHARISGRTVTNSPQKCRSERKHGLSTDQFPVSAYVGSSKNLNDLKDVGSAQKATGHHRALTSGRNVSNSKNKGRSERQHGLFTDQFSGVRLCWELEDLKDLTRSIQFRFRRVPWPPAM